MSFSVLLVCRPGHRGPDAWSPVAADAPLLSAAAIASGSDGVFETIAVLGGEARALPEHLERLALSAARCGIPAPPPALWEQGVALATAALDSPGPLSITALLHAGRPGSAPTAWIVGRKPPDFAPVRTAGVRVALLERGVLHEDPAPWLRLDAKTLAYAVPRAAVRETLRRGADEVVFRSTDGFLLEGATASILLRTGDLLQTPAHGPGVLAGTTAARLLAFGRGRGLRTEEAPLRAEALARANAAWLVSSVRRAVPVTAVDGVPLGGDPDLTAAFNAVLAAPS